MGQEGRQAPARTDAAAGNNSSFTSSGHNENRRRGSSNTSQMRQLHLRRHGQDLLGPAPRATENDRKEIKSAHTRQGRERSPRTGGRHNAGSLPSKEQAGPQALRRWLWSKAREPGAGPAGLPLPLQPRLGQRPDADNGGRRCLPSQAAGQPGPRAGTRLPTAGH